MKNVKQLSNSLIQPISTGNEQSYILPLTGRIYVQLFIFLNASFLNHQRWFDFDASKNASKLS